MIDMIGAILDANGKKLMEAKQFFKDQTPWPQGVYQLIEEFDTTGVSIGQSTPNVLGQIVKSKYILDTPDGPVEIQDGDWIVQTLDKENYFIRVLNEKVE